MPRSDFSRRYSSERVDLVVAGGPIRLQVVGQRVRLERLASVSFRPHAVRGENVGSDGAAPLDGSSGVVADVSRPGRARCRPGSRRWWLTQMVLGIVAGGYPRVLSADSSESSEATPVGPSELESSPCRSWPRRTEGYGSNCPRVQTEAVGVSVPPVSKEVYLPL